jgi:apolipoprotein N-acyltransferase
MPPRILTLGAAATAGAATVFAFAPFHVVYLPVATLAFLFVLWQGAADARSAAAVGFAFGAGLFGAGVSWVFVALNTFGGMPDAVAVVATAGFVAYLALWPALAGYLVVRLIPAVPWCRALGAAAAWTLCEWLRGFVLSGFPWLAAGYATLPPEGATPLASLAPLGGVFLVSLALALCAAAVVLAIDALHHGAPRRMLAAAALAAALYLAGMAAGRHEWTEATGAPVAVSLVQGNVAQAEKFDPAFRDRNFALYLKLARAAQGRLVVLPESAFPEFADQVPREVLQELLLTGRARGGDVLLGLFTRESPLPGERDFRYYNSVLALGSGEPQLYRKRHLVPFGETIPAKGVVGWLLDRILAIPIADQSAGDPDQAPVQVAGQRVALNICYEDVFGADLRASARAATILVNVTNDAWYGRSLAARQHNQISAMRALESGRPMLRATNTGITSAIAHDGRIAAELPWFTTGILEVEVAGRRGDTPYLVLGDALAAALSALLLCLAAAAGRRSPAR